MNGHRRCEMNGNLGQCRFQNGPCLSNNSHTNIHLNRAKTGMEEKSQASS